MRASVDNAPGGQSLAEQLQMARFDAVGPSNITGHILHVSLADGVHVLPPMLFDGSMSSASEIHLEAAGEGAILRPQALATGGQLQSRRLSDGTNASAGDVPFLTLYDGGPAIRMTRLRIEGVLVVAGGALHLSNCTLAQATTSSSRVLRVGGGAVHVEATTFEDNPGGAVEVVAGHLVLVGSWLRRNRASEGGAMFVTGGQVQMSSTVCEGNEASVRGGALFIEGGNVSITDRSLLLDNYAPTGRSVYLASARALVSLTYTLPAPLGRWIFILHGTTASLEPGAIDADYPFACNAGLVGNSYAVAAQSSPLCADVCAAGRFCGLGSITAEPCPLGAYCPAGVSRPLSCADGTYGDRTQLQSQEECTVCPEGAWCRGGLAILCSGGSYNDALGAADQSSCIPCPSYSTTLERGSRSVASCACVPGFYQNGPMALNASTGAAAAPRCVPCPVGTDCDAGAATLLRLNLRPGYYRVSTTTTDVRRCPDAGGAPHSCSGSTACASRGSTEETLSGCLGGESVASQCREGLAGLFCMLCDESRSVDPEGDGPRYYRPASGDETAECLPCDGLLGFRVGLLALGLIGLLVLLRLIGGGWRWLARRRPMLHASLVGSWHRYQLSSKLKHCVGFYQIATKIPSVYEVTLPEDVQGLLSVVAVPLDLGLEWLISPLECTGLHGFLGRLSLWMALPLAAVVLVFAGFAALELRAASSSPDKPSNDARPPSAASPSIVRRAPRMLATSRMHASLQSFTTSMRASFSSRHATYRTLTDTSRRLGVALLKATPLLLKILFVLYPIVVRRRYSNSRGAPALDDTCCSLHRLFDGARVTSAPTAADQHRLRGLALLRNGRERQRRRVAQGGRVRRLWQREASEDHSRRLGGRAAVRGRVDRAQRRAPLRSASRHLQ